MKQQKRNTLLFFKQRMTQSQLLSLVCLITFSYGEELLLSKEHRVVSNYVIQGLQENTTLQREEARYQETAAVVDQARANYFPQVTLHGRYSVATGGRSIDLPVGDMLNPVYQELNFPNRLENVDIPLLPTRDQETKIRVGQPIFDKRIGVGHKLYTSLAEQQKKTITVTKTEIASAIRQSYYGWIQLKSAEKIAKQSIQQSKEHLRSAQKLHENGVVTADILYGAEAQLYKAEQELLEYQTQAVTIQSALNKLLNTPLERELTFIEPALLLEESKSSSPTPSIESHPKTALIQKGKESAALKTDLEKASFYPSLSAFVDAGITGDEYSFDEDHRFAMGGVMLQWELFHGGKKRAAVRASRAVEKELESREREIELEIKASILEAQKHLQKVETALISAQKQKKAASEQYRLITKKFDAGLTTLTELTEAKTLFNQATLNVAVVQCSILSAQAELIRTYGITTLQGGN